MEGDTGGEGVAEIRDETQGQLVTRLCLREERERETYFASQVRPSRPSGVSASRRRSRPPNVAMSAGVTYRQSERAFMYSWLPSREVNSPPEDRASERRVSKNLYRLIVSVPRLVGRQERMGVRVRLRL